MANNHYVMSERGSAQIEIDYLRDELKKAKEQANNPVFARAVLRKQGFFVENLWSTHDVTDRYNCSPEKAQQVLEMALKNDATMEQIWFAIDDACDTLEIKSIQNQD
jgi:hypothetical protein